MAVITSWVHREDSIPASLLPEDPEDLRNMVVQTALLASAFLHAWAVEVGLPDTVLLEDVAILQALDGATAVEKNK